MKNHIILILVFISLFTSSEILLSMGSTAEFEHRIEYSSKGTRSEAKHGYLYLNGDKIGDYFTLIIYNDEAYKFFQRDHRWGKDGYFPNKAIKTDEKTGVSKEEITSEVLDRGWYEGNEKLKSTPPYWIYAEWQSGSAFVSIEKIREMADALGLKKIPRVRFLFKMMKKPGNK